MSNREQGMLTLSLALALALCVPQSAAAMHIAEGYLPAGACLFWGALCLPFVAWGLMKIRRLAQNQKSVLVILAMAGAYAFVLSALKIPSVVSGSSSHPTGTGLGTILFGPAPMAVLGLIVLVFQALLLAHGGLTTLGANTFSMAVAGPLVSWGVWRLCGVLHLNRRVAVFLAAALGDLFTYCVTSLQLALAHPSATGGVAGAAVEFLGVFALTQIPLAVIEGLDTAAAVLALEQCAQPELRLLEGWRGKGAGK